MYGNIQTYRGNTDIWGITEIVGGMYRSMGSIQMYGGMYRCGGDADTPKHRES